MVVLSVTNCPQQLRGDLTKWFIEIDIGVYVGKISTRVREKIWSRICDNIKSGKAIMVYSNNSEQGFAILTHNTEWVPVDCEGIWLMEKSNPATCSEKSKKLPTGFSKASKYIYAKSSKKHSTTQYVILDLETTGLNFDTDKVIEIGMLKFEDHRIIDQYQCFVNPGIDIPQAIVILTGITSQMISENAITEHDALMNMKSFIGNRMCEKNSVDTFIFKCKDILKSVRRKLHLDNYKLETVAKNCGIEIRNIHRALDDCKLIYRINDELNIF